MQESQKKKKKRIIRAHMSTKDVSKMGCELFYVATLSAWLGPLAMGTILGYSSPAIRSLKEINQAGAIFFSESNESWFGSIMTLGAVSASPLAGFVVDGLGRRKAMLLSSAGIFMGWLLIATARNLPAIYVGRVMTGCFTGVLSLAVPVYVSEISRPEIRGVLGAGIQLSVTVGILAVFVFGKYFTWNVLACICLVPPGLMGLLMLFMAESPRWLLSKGKSEEALRALHFLYGKEMDYEAMYRAIEENVRMSPKQGFQLQELGRPFIYKPILLTLFLMFAQQFSGINAVMFYAVSIFEAAGTTILAEDCMITIGVVQVVATLIATLAMDRGGRRRLLLTSVLLLAVSLWVLGSYHYLKDTRGDDSVASVGWLPLVCLSVFIVGFSCGMGPIPWLMMGELLPLRVRGFATGISTCFNWSTAFVVTKGFSDMTDILHAYGAYWFFCSVMVVSFIVVVLFLPETKGKTLEDIELIFRRGVTSTTDAVPSTVQTRVSTNGPHGSSPVEAQQARTPLAQLLGQDDPRKVQEQVTLA